jgi:hypothetical protein
MSAWNEQCERLEDYSTKQCADFRKGKKKNILNLNLAQKKRMKRWHLEMIQYAALPIQGRSRIIDMVVWRVWRCKDCFM